MDDAIEVLKKLDDQGYGELSINIIRTLLWVAKLGKCAKSDLMTFFPAKKDNTVKNHLSRLKRMYLIEVDERIKLGAYNRYAAVYKLTESGKKVLGL